MIDLPTIVLAEAAVFLIAFMRGAFGGGFAIIGIPLLALGMDPISAGALLAPMFCLMDIVAFRYWRPSTWSKPDVAVLVPGLLIGIGLGFFTMRLVDGRLVAIAIALITLAFAALWFRRGGEIVVRPRSRAKGALAGLSSGMTTMIAHAGGPPVAMYCRWDCPNPSTRAPPACSSPWPISPRPALGWCWPGPPPTCTG